MAGEQNSKTEATDRGGPSTDQTAQDSSSIPEKSRAVARAQRSEAAKRGWVTRKKRKP